MPITNDPDAPSNCAPPEAYDAEKVWESVIEGYKPEIHSLINDILVLRNAIVHEYRIGAGHGGYLEVPKEDCGFDFFDSFVFNELVPRVGWPDAETEKKAKGD